MKTLKLLIVAVLSLSTALIGVGYAQLSSAIDLKATVIGAVQTGVYISDVKADGDITVNSYYATVLNSKVTLTDASDTETVMLTFYNNSDDNYYFKALEHDETIAGAYTNNNIKAVPDESLKEYTKLEPKKDLSVNVTFRFADGYTPATAETLESILNFKWVSTDEEVNNVVSEKLSDVLNNKTDNEQKDTFSQLTDAMDKNFDNSREWTASYVGNVSGSTDASTELFKALFGDLEIKLGEDLEQATCIIKREDIDGNETTGVSYTVNSKQYDGCEMTMYLTTDDLKKEGSGYWATVYAVVFTKYNEEDGWVQIGEDMYAGKAQIVGYTGGYTGGSFDTGSWRSTETYHGIAAGAELKTLIQAAIKEQK